MINEALYVAGIVYIIPAPGFFLSIALVPSKLHPSERATLSVLCGLLLVVVSTLAQALWRFTPLSVWIVQSVLIVLTATVATFRAPTIWKDAWHLPRRISSRIAGRAGAGRMLLGIGIAGLISLSWSSAFSVSSIDAGWHVFWAEQIIKTGKLPDYSVIEPLDQSSRFVFGAHVALAFTSLLSGISPAFGYGVLAGFGSVATLVALYAVVRRITGSEAAGALEALVYGLAETTGGFIQRGNLPDVLGYFVLVSLLLVCLNLLKNPSGGWASLLMLGFLCIAAYHPYWLITGVLVLVMLSTIGAILFRPKIIDIVRLGVNPLVAGTTAVAISVFLVMLPNLPYLSLNAANQIRTVNWGPYVPTINEQVDLGVRFLAWSFVLIPVGFAFVLVKDKDALWLLVCWISVLYLLAQAAEIGIGLEPIRFLMRLVEPLSILVVLGAFGIYRLASAQHWPADLGVLKIRLQYRSSRARAASLAILIVLLPVLAAPILANPITLVDRYRIPQPFLATDVEIARWLSSYADVDAVVVTSADQDNTATWIQALSGLRHFLYKVDFAAQVATIPYRYVFQNLSVLYANPNSVESARILYSYNVSYVVVHGTDIQKFRYAPMLRLEADFKNAQIYSVRRLDFFGETKSAGGWLLYTAGGRAVALLISLEILYTASVDTAFVIPVYGHVTSPPVPNTTFRMRVDGDAPVDYAVASQNVTDPHVGFERFWPNLTSSGVGERLNVTVQLGKGTHTLIIDSTSGVDLEIYLEDFAGLSIFFGAGMLAQ